MKPRPISARNATANPERLAAMMAGDPSVIPKVLAGFESPIARERYGCAKAIRLLAARKPELLYPHFDFFATLLDHENKIFQWEGVRALADLAAADSENKLEKFFAQYFAPIRGPVMIAAANAIQGGARIAQAKPALADRIADEILKVRQASYATPECRNVAMGHAIVALEQIFGLLKKQATVLRFVKRQASNSRPATRKKAERFLRRVRAGSSPPTAR
jgi:hypothetical protein